MVSAVERCSCRGRYVFLHTCDKCDFGNGAKIVVCDERLVGARRLSHARRFAIGDSDRGREARIRGDSRDLKIRLRYAITKIDVFRDARLTGTQCGAGSTPVSLRFANARSTRRKVQPDD